MTPTQIAHHASGSPEVAGCSPRDGRCWLCGGAVARGALVEDWLSDTFTDHSRVALPTSPVVCEGCVYVCSRTSPVPGREAKEGKKFGANYRNVSHLWDEHGYSTASKGEKPAIREFLARRHENPWFCAIGESGQKHTLPFARVNGPSRAGLINFDDQIVLVPDDQSLVGDLIALLTRGVTKDEVEARSYYPRSIRESRQEIDRFELHHGHERGRAWFTVALWLAQRDEEKNAEYRAEKEAGDLRRRDDAGPAKRVSGKRGRKAADGLLVPPAGANAVGGDAVGERKRVGEHDAASAEPAEPAQRGFEGFG